MAEGNIEKKYTPKTLSITETTSYSGAVALPSEVINGTFICAYANSASQPVAYLVFRRDISWLMVKDAGNMSPIANTEVYINIVYFP